MEKIFIYNESIMNALVLLVIAILVFILVMSIILNNVEKDRIPLMTDFFEKVLPKIPFSKMFRRKKKNKKKK
ncbi:hypothetical protein [Flavobacterium pectinovorum]|uniref:hypothetical protein n=1 Tax=Flavobacterium pectinovorum TaxID=29533 RepID=UPI001FAD6C8C|nr:hypothetical protein [Flavobacterium pectinovorum]MCI9844554.1 hypothetical protein [Flavobacterium pectinovorum]